MSLSIGGVPSTGRSLDLLRRRNVDCPIRMYSSTTSRGLSIRGGRLTQSNPVPNLEFSERNWTGRRIVVVETSLTIQNSSGTPIYLLGRGFGTSLRESIESWNIGTNRWLRMLVYERVKKYPTILTYTLSAIWHGFYPGYYLTFASGALFTFAARTMRRSIRHYFIQDSRIKFIYNVITCIVTRLIMAYITFTFVLLEFWPSIRLYQHMYLCLHIVALLALILVPHLVPRKKLNFNTETSVNGNYVNLTTRNGGIIQALKRATPITNSMSSHHD